MSREEFNELVAATGLKKKAVAALLMVTPTTISNWASGKYRPNRLALAKLRELAAKIKGETK